MRKTPFIKARFLDDMPCERDVHERLKTALERMRIAKEADPETAIWSGWD
ncbi:hypothetical protein [Palleronia sp.]